MADLFERLAASVISPVTAPAPSAIRPASAALFAGQFFEPAYDEWQPLETGAAWDSTGRAYPESGMKSISEAEETGLAAPAPVESSDRRPVDRTEGGSVQEGNLSGIQASVLPVSPGSPAGLPAASARPPAASPPEALPLNSPPAAPETSARAAFPDPLTSPTQVIQQASPALLHQPPGPLLPQVEPVGSGHLPDAENLPSRQSVPPQILAVQDTNKPAPAPIVQQLNFGPQSSTSEAHRPAAEIPSSEPAIRVTIGRIEIRAGQPTSPPAAPPPRSQRAGPHLSLDAYLKQRSEGKR